MWKKFAGFVRMVIAINTEKSYEVSVTTEVHFKVILIEPGSQLATAFVGMRRSDAF